MLPKETIFAFARGAPGETAQTQPSYHCLSTNQLGRVASQLISLLEEDTGLTPAGKAPPNLYLKTRFQRERARPAFNAYEVISGFRIHSGDIERIENSLYL